MMHRSCIVALLLAGAISAAAGQSNPSAQPVPSAQPTPAPSSDPAAASIREIVEKAHHPDLRWPDFPYYRDEMQGLYEPRGYAPLWLAGIAGIAGITGGRPIAQARHVLDVLADAAQRGLDPEDYGAAFLASRWRELESGGTLAPEDLGRFDAGLTLALLRQISDVHIGRITPRRLKIGLDPASKKYDLVALVRKAIDENRIRATVEEAEPRFAVYRRMKATLASYRKLLDAELPEVQAAVTVRPGEAFEGLAALRARLAAFGDLRVDAPSTGAMPVGDVGDEAAAVVYEGETVAAVQRFQDRHGLAADGVLGKGTLAALAVPPSRRVRQIELALERLRWVPELEPGGPLIAVNIPAFQLWAFDALDATGTPSLTMRVVVGRSFDNRTPVFMDWMEYVVFRPYWNVPISIVRGELMPALNRDPDALAKRDMEIVRNAGDTAALAATPENVAQLATGTLKVRQRPGPRNALGLAKFIFPNSDNVYLHGTPAQSGFSRTRRDLSHGCVRLEDPEAMARFVLQGLPAWTPERIRAAMHAARPEHVNLQRKIPVLLFYTTALVDIDGTLRFYEDIYGHDARLERELTSAYSDQP